MSVTARPFDGIAGGKGGAEQIVRPAVRSLQDRTVEAGDPTSRRDRAGPAEDDLVLPLGSQRKERQANGSLPEPR